MRRAGCAALLVAPLVAWLPVAACACPVCFGNDAGPLSQGARAAAFVLLGLTALVLGGVLAFVLRLCRRQRAAATANATDPAAASATASPGGRS